ncbi:DUF2777 family protein [Bacillus songklensis]|uniref:DUF2777 family protein n=1 Tax=Bacillus songklensis TaxID=1069116 RepID=A0ABV8B378_9BACI
MSYQSRLHFLKEQPRAFVCGTIDRIDTQWVFFDDENDEAFMLDEIADDSLEVYLSHRWHKAMWAGDNILQINGQIHMLKEGDYIRVRKTLQHAYEMLLEEFTFEALARFTQHLNNLNFSLYDCIYCFNSLCFQENASSKNGVNFLIFDNEEHICSIHHFFERNLQTMDRFEYTLNNGKRLMTMSLK